MNAGWNNAAAGELQEDFSMQCLMAELAGWSPLLFFSLPSFLPPWLAASPTFTSFSTGFFPVSPPSPAVPIPQSGRKESEKEGKSPGLQG